MGIPALNAAIQGQGTVSADNLNTYVQNAQNSSELRTFTGLPGMVVMLQGISVPNDGLGGLFYWNQSGTEPDDNLNYIVPVGAGTGEWERFGILQPPSSMVYSSYTFDGTVIASGTTQLTATLLSNQINVVVTVPANSGVILPSLNINSSPLNAGTPFEVFNRGSNILSVYAPDSHQIESLGSNNPSGIAVNGNATFTFNGVNQWWVS
jgi:hypothetical protein